MLVKELSGKCEEYWWNTGGELSKEINKYNATSKKKNEENIEYMVETLIKLIKDFPNSQDQRNNWRKKGDELLDSLMFKVEEFKLGLIDKDMKDEFIESTRRFVRESKKFDNDINLADIGQAMRNVWIVNLLQKAFGHKIEFNKGIFGYSMLYPYTDNYLDNKEISLDIKKRFNDNFKKVLIGENIQGETDYEEKVYDLVKKIEELYPRENYSKVYDSLLYIHEAQVKSLSQQSEANIPYENNILGISIEKGGTSVLADGYLIYGDLTAEEMEFTYNYGFLLQLCDDIQDIEEDLKNGHNTIMTQLAGKNYLDSIVNKLINYTINLIDEANCFVGKNHLELKKLIKNNCISMILIAVIKNKKYFSKEYIESLEEYLLMSSKYIGKMDKKIGRKFNKLKESYNGVKIEDIIIELLVGREEKR